MLTDEFKKTDAPPPRPPIVVAVDGPAASGKGTLAKALAARLGYAYLDTGALYRTVARLTLAAGGDPSKLEDVTPALDTIKNHVTPELLNDPALRTPEVADAAAKVAVIPEVREAVRAYQLAFAANPPGGKGAVLDGRDIGTVVCPGADLKLFVTATAEERARRRFEEFKKRDPNLTEDEVLREINDRDRRDMTRHVSPLKAAADAYILDTTKLTPAQALEEALGALRAKCPSEGDGPAASGKTGPKPGP